MVSTCGRLFESAMLTKFLLLGESSGSRPSSSSVHQAQAKVIRFDDAVEIWSTAFSADGKHVVTGGDEGVIRFWQIEDGVEADTPRPMDTEDPICNVAVSRDERWIVCGTVKGLLQIWDTMENGGDETFQAHTGCVNAVDVSPDSTRIASGSSDKTAYVWSLSTDEQLLGPWKHDSSVVAVKFSPNGRFIATAARALSCYHANAVRVYDGSRDNHLLFDVPVKVISSSNQSLAWSSNSKQLFALSYNSKIYCLDLSTRRVSEWRIHSNSPGCIALASNDAFIAASSTSSVSFWDTTTRNQIGSVKMYGVKSVAISANYDIAIGSNKEIRLFRLSDILPSSYVSMLASGLGFVKFKPCR